jgi:hypothetical protein
MAKLIAAFRNFASALNKTDQTSTLSEILSILSSIRTDSPRQTNGSLATDKLSATESGSRTVLKLQVNHL